MSALARLMGGEDTQPPRQEMDPLRILMSGGGGQYPSPEIADIGKQYPTLSPYLRNLVVKNGQATGPGDDRQLEFYQPWERDNPHPGKLTTEIFNQDIRGADKTQAIAGDLLHHLGAVNPTNGAPVDAQWLAMKQRLMDSREPDHLQMDAGAYQRQQQSPYGAGSQEDWLQNNRSDAYIRAGLFPKQNPDWQRAGTFSPQMQAIFGEMREYLKRGGAR